MAQDDRDDRWQWRRRVRAHPVTRPVYRTVVGIVGALLVSVGCVSGPLPGPGGIPLVLAGLAVLASEFRWARLLLDRLRAEVTRAGRWVRRQPRWVRAGGSALSAVAVLACGWMVLAVAGPPALLPEAAQAALASVPGVGG